MSEKRGVRILVSISKRERGGVGCVLCTRGEVLFSRILVSISLHLLTMCLG